MTVVSNEDGIIMIEAGAKEVDEEQLLEALALAHETNQQIIRAQKELFASLGIKKREFKAKALDPEKLVQVEREHGPALLEAMQVRGKKANEAALKAVREAALARIPEENLEEKLEAKESLLQARRKALPRARPLRRSCGPTAGASTTSAPSRARSAF